MVDSQAAFRMAMGALVMAVSAWFAIKMFGLVQVETVGAVIFAVWYALNRRR